VGTPFVRSWLLCLLFLKKTELLASRSKDLVLLHLEHVESHGLGYRAALARGDDVSLLDVKARGCVHGDVRVALLESVVLLDVVQVRAANHNGTGHLRRDAHSLFNFSPNRHVAGERALLVNVVSFLGFLRGLKRQTDIAPVSPYLSILFP